MTPRLACILVLCIASRAHGDTHATLSNSTGLVEDHRELVEELAIRDALLDRLTIWHVKEGRPVYVQHCRQAPQGCEARVSAYAAYFVDAGNEYGIDPWLLAAMALKESSLNPAAIGARGEHGVLQLHPQGQAAKRARMCEGGDCTAAHVNSAAKHLAECIRVCGDVRKGLGRYNAGRCIDSVYARMVLRERERMAR